VTSVALLEVEAPATRVVDASLRCIARWGLAKTTIEDIAREAGVGRATIYRLFPGGRDAVFEAVLMTESARFFARLDLVPAESLEDFLVTLIGEGGSALAHHAALQFLLAYEPEAILPLLAFAQMDVVLRSVADLVGPYLAPWLAPDAAARGAEWVARIVFSYLVCPSPTLDFARPDTVRSFVRTYILPGLT
jgi:AcrR family transcriptional regulator